MEGKDFRPADEVRHIQRRAAAHDGRIVTIGQLILFSTETGDAWLLDPADRLAARLARDGESEPIHIEETDSTFAIDWKGALPNSTSRPSPVVLTSLPLCAAIVGSISSARIAFSAWRVPLSSAPISRE